MDSDLTSNRSLLELFLMYIQLKKIVTMVTEPNSNYRIEPVKRTAYGIEWLVNTKRTPQHGRDSFIVWRGPRNWSDWSREEIEAPTEMAKFLTTYTNKARSRPTSATLQKLLEVKNVVRHLNNRYMKVALGSESDYE